MKVRDIPDELIVQKAHEWQIGASKIGALQAIQSPGVPFKVACRAVERAVTHGLVDYGTSINFVWPTKKGCELIGVDASRWG